MPEEQLKQDRDAEEEKVPAAQLLHAAAWSAAVTVEKVPAAQMLHAALPGMGW